MKVWIVILFFCSFSSHGFGGYPLFSKQSLNNRQEALETSLSTKEALKDLRKILKEYIDSLALVLLDAKTPVTNQIEILHEFKSMADLNGEISAALIQIDQKGIDYNKEIQIRDERISLWVQSKVELIKRKQSEINNLEEIVREKKTEFYINLAIDGLVIAGGSVLMFIPAGQSVSIVLFSGHLTLTAKRLKTLGGVISTLGGIGLGAGAYSYYLSDENQETLSFISSLVFKSALSEEIFQILTSVNESDRYLAINLFKSANEEVFIGHLLSAIQNDSFSAEVKIASVRALTAFSALFLREEAIDALKDVIDNSNLQDLRQTAIQALGIIGEGRPDAIQYLKEKNDKKEYDIIRLISLLQIGRNKEGFDYSIKSLAEWLEGRNHKENPINIRLEIPTVFIDLLLSDKEEATNNKLIVVREFISSGILDIKTKMIFSETLIRWGREPKIREGKPRATNQEILEQTWIDPLAETSLYIDKLYREMRTENNELAFEILREELNKFKDIKNRLISVFLRNKIEDFKRLYLSEIKTMETVEKEIYDLAIFPDIKISSDLENLYQQAFKENSQAYNYLKNSFNELETFKNSIELKEEIIERIRKRVENLVITHSDQRRIVQKVEDFLFSYQEMLNNLKKQRN